MNSVARARSTPRGVNSRKTAVELNYSSQTEDLNRAEAARNDLLALGIDLDSDLINRLTTNLGAGSTFGAASKAAGALKARGSQSGVTYRNVNSGSGRGNAMESIRTNTNEVIQVDMQKIRSVLKELNNRDSIIEPQIRSAVLKMVEHLRILYTRAPEKFIKIMHGEPMTNAKRNALDPQTRLLLERYLDESTLTEAVVTLYPEVKFQDDVLDTLFRLLSTEDHPVPAFTDTHSGEKSRASSIGNGEPSSQTRTTSLSSVNPFLSRHAGAHKKKPYVDLWEFLTLIKLAYDGSRRTFDSKTSNLAHNVEFWNSKRAPIKNEDRGKKGNEGNGAGKKDMEGNMIRHSSKATLGREYNVGSDSTINKTNSTVIGSMLRPGIMPKEIIEKSWDDSERQRQAQKERSETVAALLGSNLKHYKSAGEQGRGRGVMGKIKNETVNKDKVDDVLHSPIRNYVEKWERNVYGKFGSQPPRRISGIFENDCTWEDSAVAALSAASSAAGSVIGSGANSINKNQSQRQNQRHSPLDAEANMIRHTANHQQQQQQGSSNVLNFSVDTDNDNADGAGAGPDESSSACCFTGDSSNPQQVRFEFTGPHQHTRRCDLPLARDREGLAMAAAMRGHMSLQNKENEVQHRRCSMARVGTLKSHELTAKPTEINHFLNTNTNIVTDIVPNKHGVSQRRNSYNSLSKEALNQTSMASALTGNQPPTDGAAGAAGSVGGAIGQQRRPSSANSMSLASTTPNATVGNSIQHQLQPQSSGSVGNSSISNIFPSFL